MAGQPLERRSKVSWLSATTRRQRVVVISKIRFWVSHWDVSAGQSRRCAQATCALCQAGLPQVYRYVVLVVNSSGLQQLVELRDRHYGLMESLRNQPRGELGAVLTIRKTGDARNSPVEITSSDQEVVVEQDITRLVDCLGLPAKHVHDVEGVMNASVERMLDEAVASCGDVVVRRDAIESADQAERDRQIAQVRREGSSEVQCDEPTR